jgi:hypothetical protein
MTEEHKRKIQEGRKKAREEKLAKGLPLRSHSKKTEGLQAKYENGKLILHITGKEENSYDFWPCLKDLLRPLGMSSLYTKVRGELANPKFWQNIDWLKETLSKYFILKEGE